MPREPIQISSHNLEHILHTASIFTESLCRLVLTLCGYVQFLSRAIQPPSIRNYLSGVKTLHSLLGFKYEFSDDFQLQLVLRGIARLNPHVPRRAKLITPEILSSVYHHMDKDSSLQRAVWACCLILFFTMTRLGSILPASAII